MDIDEKKKIPLLEVFLMTYKLVLSGVDRKKFHSTKTDFIILLALRSRPLCMSEIAECISSTKEQATRAVASLVEKGLLERFEEADNRKLVHVRLTPQGYERIEQWIKGFYSVIDSRLEGLDEADLARLRDAGTTIVEILKELE